MAKKKKHPEHVNLERWLISYADFITLLFAFFVVMFASAYSSDDSEATHLAKAVSNAFTMNVFEHGGTQMYGKKMYAVNEGMVLDSNSSQAFSTSEKKGEVERQKDLSPNEQENFEQSTMMRDQLTQEFYDQMKKENMSVSMESRGLVLSFTEVASFQEGSEQLTPESLAKIAKVVKMIKARKNLIQVEGHSDGTTQDKGSSRSNMAISTNRAENVANYLVEKAGIPVEYISTTGYGSFRPLGDNKTANGRAKNRRVDLVLLKTTPDERNLAMPSVPTPGGPGGGEAIAADVFPEAPP